VSFITNIPVVAVMMSTVVNVCSWDYSYTFCICRLVTDDAFPPGQVLRNTAETKQWVL